MATETQKKEDTNAVRIRREKMIRAARVARIRSVQEDRRVPAAEILDNAIEDGLSRIEKKLGL